MGLWGKGNTTYLRKRKTTKKKNAYRASLVSFRYIFCVSLVACFSCRLLHHLGVRLRYFHTITTLIDTLYFHRQQHLATILSLLDLVCVSFSSSSPSFRGFHDEASLTSELRSPFRCRAADGQLRPRVSPYIHTYIYMHMFTCSHTYMYKAVSSSSHISGMVATNLT